jgi:putative transposase
VFVIQAPEREDSAIARMQVKECNFAGEHFLAHGYAASTVGFNEEEIRRYIRDQECSDKSGRF